MASFKVAFKQGFNLISIPLDMTGASYEDDPRELFPAYLKTSYIPNEGFTGDYVFTRISNGINSYVNYDGKWSFSGDGSWTSISTNEALTVLVNVPPNSNMVKKTFYGDSISSPHNIQYNLVEGWNLVSYPYEIDQDFGQGSYSTTANASDISIDFCLNNNFLKGSGHSDACITNIISKKGEIQNPKFTFGLNYDGSGSNSTDWGKPDGIQKLEKFIAGSAVFLHSDSEKTNINLWSNTSQTNVDNYNFLRGTTGITTAQSDGNRGMNPIINQNSSVMYPLISTSYATSMFYIRHGNGSYQELSDSAQHSFKIRDASGTNILTIQKVASNGKWKVQASSTEYVIGFFVDRLFDLDSNRPNWGNRGYINGFGSTAGTNDFMNNINSMTSIDESGMEHTSIGSLSSTYPSPISGIPDNDFPTKYLCKAGDSGNNVHDFPFYNNREFAEFSRPSIRLNMDNYYMNNLPDPNNPLVDVVGQFYVSTGFIPDDHVVPVIYDPNATDGERYRFCKYYPHKNDLYNEIYFGNPNPYGSPLFRDHPDYSHIFYDENGNFKFDPVLGDPYLEPVFKKIPYRIFDHTQCPVPYTAHQMAYLSGIIQML